jgi:hypothetical protein
VTIGWDAPELLRDLSDARRLTCPACDATVVLHAGSVRAHHFAHLPGAVCSMPQAEPETEEHRAGKLLLARWLRERLPDAEVTIEAYLPATSQRADILLRTVSRSGEERTVALEYQCANLTAREWQRRHRLYRDSGIEDLWILGGSRCAYVPTAPDSLENAGSTEAGRRALRTGELERAMLAAGAPLLFLDAVGTLLPEGTLARFRPAPGAQAVRPDGRLSARPLLGLTFPWGLLDWELTASAGQPVASAGRADSPRSDAAPRSSGEQLWQWLEQRYRVTPASLSPLFGIPAQGQEVVLCEAPLWQAAVYYRFIHQRVGGGWWLQEVETWARAYLPLASPLPIRKLRSALRVLQEFFAAAGLLTLPSGYSRSNARVAADLSTLPAPPDRVDAMRLAGYRRTLNRA